MRLLATLALVATPMAAAAAMAAATSCIPRARRGAEPGRSRAAAPRATPAGRAGPSEGVAWRYEVEAGPMPELVLHVDAQFAATADETLDVDDDARPFVHDLVLASPASPASPAGGAEPDAWRPATKSADGAWIAPCHAVGCHARYTIALGEAAARIHDPETAWSGGGIVIAPPSTWLLRPAGDPRDGERFRFHVTLSKGLRFAAGVRAARDGSPGAYEADTAAMPDVSFGVFGVFQSETVDRDGARVDVAVAPSGLSFDASVAREWVATAVSSLAGYYGRFPVPRTLVIVAPGSGTSTRGVTLGDGGPAIVVRPLEGFARSSIADDWVLTHELVHVTLPTLGRGHAWLEEGTATYVEPIARARAGLVTPARYWSDLVEGLPQGLPGPGDEGLERTHTWGRTYWGGALFCLEADIRIRERTRGARSFDDALRAIAGTGDDVEQRWSMERFIETGDRATGTTVLAELYRELALAPGTVDLATLWARLGVRRASEHGGGGAVTFDDAAPLASIRRAITQR